MNTPPSRSKDILQLSKILWGRVAFEGNIKLIKHTEALDKTQDYPQLNKYYTTAHNITENKYGRETLIKYIMIRIQMKLWMKEYLYPPPNLRGDKLRQNEGWGED